MARIGRSFPARPILLGPVPGVPPVVAVDSAPASDSVSRGAVASSRTVTDTAAASDAVVAGVALLRTVADSAPVSDSVAYSVGHSPTSITTDASSPASVTATGRPASVVTASFTPPANTLLCALIACGWNSGAPVAATVSDSGGHLWTKKAEATVGSVNGGLAAVWTCPLTSAPGAITVTMSITGWAASGGGVSLDLLVLNGAAANQAGAATGTKSDQTGSLTDTSVNVTTTQVGSRVYGVTDCSALAATWTHNSLVGQDRQFNDTTDAITIAQWISVPSTGTVTPGTAAYGGTTNSATDFNTAALEILAAVPSSVHIKSLIVSKALRRSTQY